MTASAASLAHASLGSQLAAAHRPRALVYWSDLLASAAAGWGLLAVGLSAAPGSPLHLAATLGGAIALLRAAYFAHEVAHLSRRALPGFELAWHVLAAVPLLIPGLMVGAHKNHHRVATYGTVRDPEYAPIASWRPWRFVVDLAAMLPVPGLLMLRWGLLGPLSYLHPGLRRVVVGRMSTLAINPHFVREAPRGRERRRWLVQEACMAVFVWCAGALVWHGVIPLTWVAQYWLVFALALVLNEVRTYVAHAYAGDGEPMTIDEQVRDSLTLGGWFLLTDLLAPLGDRYHAAHHRYPSLPYHGLPEAHRRLAAAGEGAADYRTTFRDGLSGALRGLVSRMAAAAGALVFAFVVPEPAEAQLYLDQQFGVSVTSGVAYATGAVQFPFSFDKTLHLDVYEPTGAGAPTTRPGYVLIHGGAFATGSRTNATIVDLATRYAARGYVAVSIDYRKIPDDPPTPGATPFDRAANAAIEDAANAVRWLRANAASYGVDPTRIAIGGYSAGAITSLGVAYDEHGPDAEVQAVVSLAGGMYGNEGWIDAGEAPLLLVHGTDDPVVPYPLALAVHGAALLAPIDVEFVTLSGVDHDVPAHLDTWMVGGVTLETHMRDFTYAALGLAPPPAVPVAGGLGAGVLVALLALCGVAAARRARWRGSPASAGIA